MCSLTGTLLYTRQVVHTQLRSSARRRVFRLSLGSSTNAIGSQFAAIARPLPRTARAIGLGAFGPLSGVSEPGHVTPSQHRGDEGDQCSCIFAAAAARAAPMPCGVTKSFRRRTGLQTVQENKSDESIRSAGRPCRQAHRVIATRPLPRRSSTLTDTSAPCRRSMTSKQLSPTRSPRITT
jgi:hypothetical protein